MCWYSCVYIYIHILNDVSIYVYIYIYRYIYIYINPYSKLCNLFVCMYIYIYICLIYPISSHPHDVSLAPDSFGSTEAGPSALGRQLHLAAGCGDQRPAACGAGSKQPCRGGVRGPMMIGGFQLVMGGPKKLRVFVGGKLEHPLWKTPYHGWFFHHGLYCLVLSMENPHGWWPGAGPLLVGGLVAINF